MQQRQGLQQPLRQAQALTPVFLQRIEIRRQLFKKEGANGDEPPKLPPKPSSGNVLAALWVLSPCHPGNQC